MADSMSQQLHFDVEHHHDFIHDGQLWNLYRQDGPICPLGGGLPESDRSGFVRLEDVVYFIKDGSLYSHKIDEAFQPDGAKRINVPDHGGPQVILGLVPHVDYIFVWTANAIFRFGRKGSLSQMRIFDKNPNGKEEAKDDLAIRQVAILSGLPERVELLIQSTTNKVYKAFLIPPNVLVRKEVFEDDGQLLGGFRDTIVMISSKEGQKTSLKLFENSRFSSEVVPAMRLEEGSTAFLDEHCVHVIDPEDGRIESMNLLNENLRWTTPEASVLVRGGWAFRGETDGPTPHWCMERGNPLQV